MENKVDLSPKAPRKHNYSQEDIVVLNMAYDKAKRESAEMQEEEGFAYREKVIAELAAKFDTSLASVRGKLVSEGVYQPRTYVSKRPYKASKEVMVARMEKMLNMQPGQLESLEKVNKQCLEELVHAMKLLQCGVIEADMAEYYEGL